MIRPLLAANPANFHSLSRRRLYSSATFKPLRILFCGSDLFSGQSLKAVHAEQQRNPKLIASIDVLVKRAKPAGRGLKQKRDVPIKSIAQQLGLPIHEINTFSKWMLPHPQNESINLIIAVSFGLFVPSRLLKEAEYGGLNVHPSLLPNFRGAAPLQHQLLAGETRTGVTLQTLDHGKFDHGIVLAQTEPPGIVIPPRCSYIKLLQMVTPKAAEILVNGLRDGLYLPPFVDIGKHHKDPLKVAPKITPEDRRIDWSNWDATTIIRQARALGKPWTVLQDFKGKKLRVVFEDVNGVDLNDFEHLPHQESLTAEDDITDHKEHTALCPTLNFLAISTGDLERRITCCVRGDAMIFIDGNGDAMSVREMTVEGKPTKCARLVMSSFVATPLKTEDTRQLKKIPAS